MFKIKSSLCSMGLALLFCGAAGAQSFFDRTMELKDDDLEVEATLSTFKAHGPMNPEWPRFEFIKASIDKKTLRTSYAIHATHTYEHSEFYTFTNVKFQTPSGPKAAQLLRTGQKVDCSRKQERSGKCRYMESVAFLIDEDLFKQIASTFNPEANNKWRFRLSSVNGDDLDRDLVLAEFKAVVDHVEKYIAARPK